MWRRSFFGRVRSGRGTGGGKVVLPPPPNREFPERVGLMTSVYTTALGISGALAAGVSVPLAQLTGMGWRESLALWALPAFIAAVAWLPHLRRSDQPENVSAQTSQGGSSMWRS